MKSLLNREQLRETLRAEGINPHAYDLHGSHAGEQYVMDNRPGAWVVFYSERGSESALREFVNENEACEYLLKLLRSDPTTHFHLVVGPLPAGEADTAFLEWKNATGLTHIDPTDIKVDNPILNAGSVRRYWVRGTLLPPSHR